MSRIALTAVAVALVAVACSNPDTVRPGDGAAPVSVPLDTAVTTTAAASTTTTPESTTVPGTAAPPSPAATAAIEDVSLRLVEVASGFGQPVFATSPPGDDRLFVVDQPGRVWVVAGTDPKPFLDIRDRVTFGGEQGLLGLAFPDDYATTGRFYVNYTGPGGATRVSEFAAIASDPNLADAASERVVLEVAQPASNHNGGMIAFGPDGMLWIGFGDGGRANDAFGHGQNPETLLGSMVRIDPTCCPYTAPETNPASWLRVADVAGWAPEVWAIGLRNPWRFSFDGELLYVADVGQGAVEEISVTSTMLDRDAPFAPNFGWPVMEGSDCFQASSCDTTGLILPVHEYRHDEGCSITGGFVYRGSAVPALHGHYFFGDFCGGWIRSIDTASDSGTSVEWFPPGAVSNLTSFGRDAAGELYVMSAGGSLFRIEPD